MSRGTIFRPARQPETALVIPALLIMQIGRVSRDDFSSGETTPNGTSISGPIINANRVVFSTVQLTVITANGFRRCLLRSQKFLDDSQACPVSPLSSPVSLPTFTTGASNCHPTVNSCAFPHKTPPVLHARYSRFRTPSIGPYDVLFTVVTVRQTACITK